LNQAESYAAQVQLARAGVDLVPFGEPADLTIVNTCTVTHVADQQARQTLRRARRISPEGWVLATGCYVQVSPHEARAVEGVDGIISSVTDGLVARLEQMGAVVGRGEDADFDEPLSLAQGAALPATRVRQFVKVQDGCDDYCTYCIVPFARGHALSRPADAIVAEVRELVARGCQEVVLTGVQIGAYGRDRYRERGAELALPGQPLAALIRRVLDETPVARLRVSSIQPQDWSPAFFELFADPRFGRHLHLPLQAGSDATLRRMSRRYSTGDFAELVARVRDRAPDVAITADIIVGFPGESEDDHEASLAFVREMAFADAHVFRYSPRRGTAASRMGDQVPPEAKKARSESMRALVEASARSFRQGLLGTERPVLWEEELTLGVSARGGTSEDGSRAMDQPHSEAKARMWSGLTDNYLRVVAECDDDLLGQIRSTRLELIRGDQIVGRVE
jgi:threonylcarbamoyladenosine tRNA methylthiotransferase MtaB